MKVLKIFVAALLVSTPAMAQEKFVLDPASKQIYTIALPADAPAFVTAAAADLKRYLGPLTGAEPRIVTGDAPLPTPFISLGATRAAREAGITAAQPVESFRIVARHNNLFILGNDASAEQNPEGGASNGTSNGIYAFCEEYLGVRWLLPTDLGEDIPQPARIEIPLPLDRTVVPRFPYRVLPYTQNNRPAVRTWERRLRVGSSLSIQHQHSWDQVIPPSYYERHPEWFAEIGGKRLPPAGRYKLETTNPELVREFANRIIEAFRQDPARRSYSLSPSDGSYWSESPASLVLYDKDPNGNKSLTRLVLKFYNDVAKIVGQKFPDRKLGGYIYADYLYPPSDGIPSLEPNLSLVIAASVSYGYRLYRPDVRGQWVKLINAWAEGAKNTDLYYYDLPTYFKQSSGTIMPPAPEILNFIFSHLQRHKNIRGIYIYGNEPWVHAGVGNYVQAQLMWNPDQDASKLCWEYYSRAYDEGGPYVQQLYTSVDNAFRDYYLRHPEATYNLTPSFLTEIYGPIYPKLDELYARALTATSDGPARRRLELFGSNLSLLQWNLKQNGILPADYKSALTLPDNQIDQLARTYDIKAAAIEIAPFASSIREGAARLELQPAPALDANSPVVSIPLRGPSRFVLKATENTIRVTINKLQTQGELVRFSFLSGGQETAFGLLRANRQLELPAVPGQDYYLNLDNTWSQYELAIQGAAWATESDVQPRGLRFDTNALPETGAKMWFQVPPGTGAFNLTVNGPNVLLDVIDPAGNIVGQVDTRKQMVNRFAAPADAPAGFWRLRVHRTPDMPNNLVYLVLDPKLPQWMSSDLNQPLSITSK